MNRALQLDSLTGPSAFDRAPDPVHVVDIGAHDHHHNEMLRPYHEVGAILVIAGLFEDVPSLQQIVDIERRALRKLKAHPEIRRLHKELFESGD